MGMRARGTSSVKLIPSAQADALQRLKNALDVSTWRERWLTPLLAQPERVRREAIGYAAAVGSIIVTSLLIDVIQRVAHVSNISLLYLLAVIVLAWRFGSGPSILSAVLAFMTYDW